MPSGWVHATTSPVFFGHLFFEPGTASVVPLSANRMPVACETCAVAAATASTAPTGAPAALTR